MAKPKIDPNTPPEHHWVCEGCWAVNLGVDPPDYCRVCEHVYFDNMADSLREQDAERGRLH